MLTSWKTTGLSYDAIRERRKAEISELLRSVIASEQAVELAAYPGYYVTPCGKVYSTGGAKVRFTCLRPGKKPGGYRFVGLRGHDGLTYEMVHRLVATTFISNPDGLPEVNHRNGDKDDNDRSNLEWCTRAQNARHAAEHGLMHAPGVGGQKLTPQEIQEIKSSGESCKRTGLRFGVSAQTVCNIRRGYLSRKQNRQEAA